MSGTGHLDAKGRDEKRRPPKLMTLEGDYSLATLVERGLEKILLSRDLDGFFDHVWTVYPAVGADPSDPSSVTIGPPSVTAVSSRHTMVEGRIGLLPQLRWLPPVNFGVSQLALLLQLHRIIRRENVNIVRASDPFFLGPLALVLARLNRVPFVIRLIGNYDSEFFSGGRPVYPRLFRYRWVEKRIDRFVLRRADLVAAGNEDIRRYALANGAPPDRTTVFLVGNLIDPVHFEIAPEDRPSVRAELGVGDRPLIACVSRLERIKHVDDVLQVLVEVRAQRPEVVGLLVGDGSMRQELEASARDLGLEDHLIFVGNRNQQWIASALASATVVLSPLTGRSLVEATLSGTPVAAYDTDWQSELIEDGKTGLLVPYRDTRRMADAVLRLLADPGYGASLAANAREFTLARMNARSLDEHERSEYQRLLEQKHGHRVSAL